MIANQEYLNDEIEQLRIGFQDKAILTVLLVRPHQMRRNIDSKWSGTEFHKKKKSILDFQQKVSKIPLQDQNGGRNRTRTYDLHDVNVAL